MWDLQSIIRDSRFIIEKNIQIDITGTFVDDFDTAHGFLY
jgi:hypothetical protein